MSNQTPASPPPGYYADPSGAAHRRWWDGTKWTEDTQAAAGDGRPVQPPLAEGVKVNTPFIWFIALSPLFSAVSLFFVDWTQYFRASLTPTTDPTAAMAAMFQPGYLAVVGLGWLLAALTIVASYLDWRALKKIGVVKPFHWAWAFLNPVYIIGRTVVAKRRVGEGMAPLWVFIGSFVLAMIISFTIVGIAMSEVLSTIDFSTLQ